MESRTKNRKGRGYSAEEKAATVREVWALRAELGTPLRLPRRWSPTEFEEKFYPEHLQAKVPVENKSLRSP